MRPEDTKRGHTRRRSVPVKRRAFLYGAAATAIGTLAAWQLGPTGSEMAPPAEAPVTTDAIGDRVQTPQRGQLPVFVGRGEIARLYRYAVENGDELQFIPCFCGCARSGHESNRDCYIKSFNPDGTLTFTSHAAT
jgi:hypothetical protein